MEKGSWRKRKKDDERHERKKGKKESSKSSLSAASDDTAGSRRSPLDASSVKDAGASTTSRNEVDGNAGEGVKDNADSKDKDGEACMRQSPEPNCSICLSKLENKSFTDSCFHTFCFVCLLEWSKIKTECPLCKQPFKSIIHNVRSYDDYDQYDVQKQDVPDERRFRYRTTLTVDRLLALTTRGRSLGEIAEPISGSRSHMTTRHSSRRLQQQQQQHQQLQQQLQRQIQVVQQQQQQQHHHQLQYSSHSLEFRRSVYRNNLQIVKGRNTGCYRNTKPDFLQKNPTAIHRLAPWLQRELNVLLRHQESHVSFVMELILDLIKCYPISSEEFYQHVLPFVGRNTSHFMREFENFAKSAMPDMRSYDENTQYVPFTQLVDSNTDASSTDDDDDDVIVLSPRETTTATATATTSGNHQSSISVSISLGHPAQQIVMTSSSWDKQSSDKSQAESSTSNGQTSTSGWESPQPGTSGVLLPSSSSIVEATNATTEATAAETGPASESTTKPETTSLRRQLECSSDSNESEAVNEQDNNAEDSDVMIVGYEKPYAERSPILISDERSEEEEEEEEAEQAAEKSEETSLQTRLSASESHRSGEGSIKRSSSQQKERSHRKSRHDKYSSSSSPSKERRRRERNLRSSTAPSFETTLYKNRISSRSRSKSRSGSRSRHSKSKSSGSSYSTKESRRQRHREDSPTSSSSSLQLHISQRSIFCPLFNSSNVYRVGNAARRTLTEYSSSACEFEGYSHSRSHRKHRSSFTPVSPVRHPSRARSRSSSVEIIACKRQRKSHKKHKKHKHRKHHRSKHSSKVSSSACGSVSDSNFASGGSDVVPISPPPASHVYNKKHHSGYKNSHLKRRGLPTSPSTDDVHIIATVQGERPYLDGFPKYTNSLRRPISSTATASCSQSSFKERIFPMSPLGSQPSSPIIDPIGADVVIPSEGNVGENSSDMLTKTISVPVSTCGTLDEINDPDLKLMIPDFMDMRPSSPSSPKPDCMQANSDTSTTLTSASQIALSCGLDTSKWLPLSLSADPPSLPENPDCQYDGKTPGDFYPFIGQVDRGNPDTSKPSATVTLASANVSKSLPSSNSNTLNMASSVFGLMSSDSDSSSSSAISVTDHDPITHMIKPFSMSPTPSLDPGPSTSLASFQPLALAMAFDGPDIATPMSSTHRVETLNPWGPQEGEKRPTASGAEQQSSSDHGNPFGSKETSSTSLLDTLSTICSMSAAKLPDPVGNSELKKSNLLPLCMIAMETWQSSSPSSPTSSLNTLAAAASLSIISSSSSSIPTTTELKTVCNTTSKTTNNTTTTSEISSPFDAFTAVPAGTSVSPVATTSALSLPSPERKAREEAICTDNDIQSIISEVFALNSQSDIIPPQRERVGSIRSPLPPLPQGEKPPNSGNYNNYQAQSQSRSPTPSSTQGKLLIDMGDGNFNKKSDVDDDYDFSDSDSSSSNLPSFLDKTLMQRPQQPAGASSSASEAKRRKMISSPCSPGSGDNKSQVADGLYEYSSLNMSPNKKSPLKLTLKRLKPSPPEVPSASQVSHLMRASSSQSGFSSRTRIKLEPDEKPSFSSESAINNTFREYLNGRDVKPDPDSPAVAPKDSTRSPYQTGPAANRSSQDNLFGNLSSSDGSNVQSCNGPDFPGLQPPPPAAAGSPPQPSKPPGGGLVGDPVSKPASQESSQVEGGHTEVLPSGGDELNSKECEGSNHGTDYKMIRSSELLSQGDVSDDLYSGVDDDDHDLFSSSEL